MRRAVRGDVGDTRTTCYSLGESPSPPPRANQLAFGLPVISERNSPSLRCGVFQQNRPRAAPRIADLPRRNRPSRDIRAAANRSFKSWKADIRAIRASSCENRPDRTYEQFESNGRTPNSDRKTAGAVERTIPAFDPIAQR